VLAGATATLADERLQSVLIEVDAHTAAPVAQAVERGGLREVLRARLSSGLENVIYRR
jgi:hypothetical protein